jgi:hypothetical protein
MDLEMVDGMETQTNKLHQDHVLSTPPTSPSSENIDKLTQEHPAEMQVEWEGKH